LYRSQISGNNYSKLNQNIITDTLFVDTLLNGPGRYYYVYTVVDGNFNESSFSTEAFVITTDIITENNVPAEYSLANNFPNPFNPITTISYSLDVNSFVTLDIYNVIGEKVENLVKEFQNSGNHRINFNAVNLPSGIYFYALVSNNRVLVKKMTIIK
jgi:hypothetical protein